jgi:hypothetical protein
MANIKTNIRGIQRNTPDAETDMGSAQEIINMRNKDGAWRAMGKKSKTPGSVQVSHNHKQIGWYHHPSNDDSMLISFDSVDKKILLHNTLTGTNVIVKNRNGSYFVLPSDEDFNCFTHLENVLVLLGTKDRYNFLWINGAFEYVEFGGIDWTLTKTLTGNITLGAFSSKEECIADYIAQRNTRASIGQIDGICAFRLAIELFDSSFAWYSDIKILRGTALYVSDNVYNIYEPKIYISGGNHWLYNFTDYRPIIDFTIPEWLTYYIEVGIIKTLHVCSTKPVYPNIPDVTKWEYQGVISGFDAVWQIKAENRRPHILFPDETDVFYSIFKIDATNKIPPTSTEIFPFTDIQTREVIPLDNFTSNKTSAKHSFIYNQRLHLQQIYNTLGNPIPIDNDWAKNYGVVPYFVQYEVYQFIDDDDASGIFGGAVPTETTQYICMVINGLGGFAVNNFKLCSVVYNTDTSTWSYTIIAGELVSGFYAQETGALSSDRYVLRDGATAIFQDPTTIYGEILPTTQYAVTATYEMYTDVIVSINNKQYVTRVKCNEIYYQVDGQTNQVYAGRFFYYPHPSAKEVRFSFSKDGVNFYKVKNPTKQIKMLPNTVIPISRSVTDYDTQLVFSSLIYTDAQPDDIKSDVWLYQQYRYMILSVPVSGVDYATHNSCELCTELDGSYIDTNRLQLSELSNPFVLPATNSYRFGDINNEVNGVEVTHEQLSETRFGAYPLYVFTKQGIFALESGSGSIVYSSLDYLKKHKVTDHETITNSKGYAIFRTDEGFFALSGREFQNISTPVQGSNVIDIQSDTKFQALLTQFNSLTHNHLSLNNFLANTDYIACHDHVEDELWLSLTSSLDASYVFNFNSKSWFKTAETFQYFVNLSPDVVGVREKAVSSVWKYDFYDMHDEDDFTDLKLFVSRPISFGSDYYKRIEHFVSRFRVEQSGETVLPTKFYLYGSIDGFEYKIIQGGEISDNMLQDQEIRRCFVSFKYLIIVLGFNHENCEVVGFESEVKEKFKTKLR